MTSFLHNVNGFVLTITVYECVLVLLFFFLVNCFFYSVQSSMCDATFFAPDFVYPQHLFVQKRRRENKKVGIFERKNSLN